MEGVFFDPASQPPELGAIPFQQQNTVHIPERPEREKQWDASRASATLLIIIVWFWDP